MSYDPNSTDAMLARIIQRLDNQDTILHEIKEQVYKTNGRVNGLENDKWFQRGVVAVIGIIATALWNWISNPK